MRPLTAVYDACVLYPAPLRSLLMYLALTDLFRARWTDAIHEEWMRNVQKDFPDLTREKVERVRTRTPSSPACSTWRRRSSAGRPRSSGRA
jgi:hypothetical protein